MHASIEELDEVAGIDVVVAQGIHDFFHSESGRHAVHELQKVGIDPKVKKVAVEPSQLVLAGQSVVVTGTLESLDRAEIEELIAKLGGKPSGSVSKKTSFVVAGENAGSKLDKAKQLGVPVITEREFLKKIGQPAEKGGGTLFWRRSTAGYQRRSRSRRCCPRARRRRRRSGKVRTTWPAYGLWPRPGAWVCRRLAGFRRGAGGNGARVCRLRGRRRAGVIRRRPTGTSARSGVPLG